MTDPDEARPGKSFAQFSHVGLCCTDLEAMEQFYKDRFGLVETDRGVAAGMDIVFLSSDPHEHHQLVLTSGRPAGLPQNTQSPFFGAVINQISFRAPSLAAVREMHDRAVAEGIGPILAANHGLSFSVYLPDPDGNIIEYFYETGWFCQQPVLEPTDFSRSDAELLEEARALCESQPGFTSMSDFQARLADALQART